LSRWLLTRCLPEDEALHLADSNLRLLPEALGQPLQLREHYLEIVVNAEHRAAAERFIQTRHLQGRRLIGFHPGSGTTKNLVLKRWDMAQWATLGQQLCEKHPDVVLLLFGSQEEENLRAEIRAQCHLPTARLVDAGNLALKAAAALLGKMHIMVGIDGLLVHLAATQGVPCVALFGPTPPAATHPYGVPYRIARLNLWCSPCYRYSRHGIRCINPNFLQCLRELTPATVAAQVDELLRETPPRPSHRQPD
jgi:ADP-heptose:LPS heptosyltransferase